METFGDGIGTLNEHAEPTDEEDDDVFPFRDAFEDDVGTFPYGTHTATASHVVTQNSVTLEMIKIADVGPETFFVDIGCGIGRVSNLVAQTSKCQVLGIDISEDQILQAQNNASPDSDTRYVACDMYKLNDEIQGVSSDRLVIFMYLIPKMINSRETRKLLEPHIRSGAKVVTSVYHPEFWNPSARSETFNLNVYDSASLIGGFS